MFLQKYAVVLSLLTTALTAQAMASCEKPSDVSDQMGPIKSQDNLGFCYAFAGVSLLEQYSCRMKSKSCDLKDKGGLSVSDALAQNGVFHEGSFGSCDMRGQFMSSTHFSETGDTERLLENVSKTGLCPSRSAPYISEFFPDGSASRVWNKIADFFSSQRGNARSVGAVCLAATDVVKNLSPKISSEGLVDLLSNMVEKISTATSASDYLKEVMVSKSCEANKVDLPPYKVRRLKTRDFGGAASHTEIGQAVINQLQNGGAVELDIDAGRAFPDMHQGPGHWHAVTVVGNKMVNGKCYFKLRNSWGEQWQKDHNDGWLDAEQLTSVAVGATWIDPKGV